MWRSALRDVVKTVLMCSVVLLPDEHLCAEQSPSSSPGFDVISIKPVPSDSPPQMVISTPQGGGINAVRVTPRFLIRYAFAVDDSLIVGAPDWTASARFDVLATGRAGVSADTTRAMVRSLLAERFSLQAHTETRELPVYALAGYGPGGNLGENLRRAPVACIERDPRAARSSPPRALPPPAEPMPCGLRVAFGHISGGGVTMRELSNVLIQPTGRPVLDRTALTGIFDLVMNFTPEVLRLGTAGATNPDAAQPDARPVPPDPTAPSIFTAMQEQLGLKLEPSRAQIEVLVVDGIEYPTPN